MYFRRSSARSVYLPWERRGGILRRIRRSRLRPVVLALLAAALLGIIIFRERQRTAQRATRAALTVVHQALAAYRADHEGRCPRALEELEAARYVARLPKDAWGRSLRLVCPSRVEGVPYHLMSDGSDGEPGGLDRIE